MFSVDRHGVAVRVLLVPNGQGHSGYLKKMDVATK